MPEAAFPDGSGHEPRDGIVLRQYRRFPRVAAGGRFAAEPAHALAQALPTLDREHGVAVMDSLLNKRILTRSGLRKARRLIGKRRDCAKTEGWWELADGRSQSPVETAARLRCVDAGIPPDDLQRDLVDAANQFLGRADLAWYLGYGRWLLVELDSDEFHTSADQVRRDAIRSVLTREAWAPNRPIPPRPPARRRRG
ncbi:hypothetical protein ACQEVI_04385 [Promicromonospora sp. CA-289599]|uniref:hypothetical protein n=1 Tax=Promicromonospora sp. CA-289599 TaxID=3240014 RepID=UPI003D8F469A